MKVAYSPTSMVAITINWLVGSFVMFHVQMLAVVSCSVENLFIEGHFGRI